LGGRTVLPGFTDGHVHWANYALNRLGLELDAASSLSEVVRLVRQAVTRKEPDQWIVGRGWDQTRWGRWPSRADLDAAAPNNPVALTRKDGHVVWVNTAALVAAGIEPTTPEPAGGTIERSNGDLLGILKENAVGLVRDAMPLPNPVDRQAAMVDSWVDAWSRGITGCHDMGFMGGGALFRDVATLRDAGELGLRFVWYFPKSALEEAVGLGLRSGLGDEWLRVGGLKLFLDGTLGAQTAQLLEPYAGQPDNTGLATLSDEELLDLMRQAEEARLAVAVHAIGDAAVRRALDGFALMREEFADRPRPRHRLEHIQLLHPDDLPRFADLGVAASVQPIHFAGDLDIARTYWGERESLAYAWRDLADSGAEIVFGSDAPVESPDVFAGIHTAVTRRPPGRPGETWHPEQAVSVEQALRAYTVAPAHVAGQADALGTLEPGKRADLIVVDPDPFLAPEDELAQTRVLATMIDGVWVWQRPELGFVGPRG
jgi:hypothetical protein